MERGADSTDLLQFVTSEPGFATLEAFLYLCVHGHRAPHVMPAGPCGHLVKMWLHVQDVVAVPTGDVERNATLDTCSALETNFPRAVLLKGRCALRRHCPFLCRLCPSQDL